MHPPVAARRAFYRLAYALLRVWWLVARPSLSGVKCALTDGDLVLLVRHTYGGSEWDLPGGTVKRHEDPIVTARREMLEELGIEIRDWVPIGQMRRTIHHRQDTVHCFQARIRSPPLVIDRGELAAAQWFSRRALPSDLTHSARAILDHTEDPGTDPVPRG